MDVLSPFIFVVLRLMTLRRYCLCIKAWITLSVISISDWVTGCVGRRQGEGERGGVLAVSPSLSLALCDKALAQRITNRGNKLWMILHHGTESRAVRLSHAETYVMSHQSVNQFYIYIYI